MLAYVHPERPGDVVKIRKAQAGGGYSVLSAVIGSSLVARLAGT